MLVASCGLRTRHKQMITDVLPEVLSEPDMLLGFVTWKLVASNDSAIFSDGFSSDFVITGDHSDFDTCDLALGDGGLDSGTEHISDTGNDNEGKAFLLNGVNTLGIGLLVLWKLEAYFAQCKLRSASSFPQLYK